MVSNSTTIYALKNGDVKFSKDFKNYPFLSINEYDDEYFAGLALDSVQNKIYATNGNDTVIVLNYSLGVIDTLDVFKKYGDSRIRGIGIDPDLQTIFVTNSDFDPDMIALNLSTRKIVGEIATEDYHDEIIVDRDTHLVYSIDNEEHLLNIIDEKSNGFFNVSLGDFAPRDLVSYKDGKILLIDDSASRLLWIDSHTSGHAEITNQSVIGNFNDYGFSSIAVNQQEDTLYILNEPEKLLKIFDLKSMKSSIIHLPFTPSDIAYDSLYEKLYILDRDENGVYVVDTNILNNIPEGTENLSEGQNNEIPVGNSPVDIAINSYTNRGYVANYDSQTISVIDLKEHKQIDTIRVDSKPTVLEINPIKNMLYVGYETKPITLFDTITNLPVNETDVGSSGVMIYDERENKIYVINGTRFYSLEGGTGRELSSFDLGRMQDLFRSDGTHDDIMAISPKTGNVLLSGEDQIYKFEPSLSNFEPENIPISSPKNIAIDTEHNIIYVKGIVEVPESHYAEAEYTTSSFEGKITHYDSAIYTLDLITNRTLGVVSAGLREFGNMVVNPNNNLLYVVDIHGNSVIVIDGIGGRIIKEIPVGLSPSSIVVDAKRNLLYVANKDSNSVTLIDGRSNLVLSPRIKINFESQPPEGGDIFCNGEVVTNRVQEYVSLTEIECQVSPHGAYTFGRWSGLTSEGNQQIAHELVADSELIAQFNPPPISQDSMNLIISVLGGLIGGIPAVIIGYFLGKRAGRH